MLVETTTTPLTVGGLTGPAYVADDQFHEVFTLFSFLAAATSTLRFRPRVIILPQRETALAARPTGSAAWASPRSVWPRAARTAEHRHSISSCSPTAPQPSPVDRRDLAYLRRLSPAPISGATEPALLRIGNFELSVLRVVVSVVTSK